MIVLGLEPNDHNPRRGHRLEGHWVKKVCQMEMVMFKMVLCGYFLGVLIHHFGLVWTSTTASALSRYPAGLLPGLHWCLGDISGLWRSAFCKKLNLFLFEKTS